MPVAVRSWNADQATKQREIYDRRQDRALEGQSTMLRWLVRHGATDEHRLQAFAAVRKFRVGQMNGSCARKLASKKIFGRVLQPQPFASNS